MVYGGKENLLTGYGGYIAEAVHVAEYIILQTGQTALGPAVYGSEKDLVPSVRPSSPPPLILFSPINFPNFSSLKSPQLRPKLEALREEYLRYGIQKCEAILTECQPALEDLVGEDGEKGREGILVDWVA